MKSGKTDGRLDVYIAIALIALGSFVSVLSYASILEIDNQETIKLGNIQEGNHNFVIRDKERCVGRIATSLTSQEIPIVSVQGVIQTVFSEQEANLNFELKAEFNSLGQLVKSESKIEASGLELALSTSNANPITGVLKITFNDKLASHELELPGPLKILKQDNNISSFSYSRIDFLKYIPKELLGISATGKNSLTIAEVTEKNECSERLDITPILLKFQSLVSTFAIMTSGEHGK